MTGSPDDRSAMAVALGWASRVMSVSIEMVLPGLLGLWLDYKLQTVVLFTVLGFGFGMALAIWHLLRMTATLQKSPRSSESTQGRRREK